MQDIQQYFSYVIRAVDNNISSSRPVALIPLLFFGKCFSRVCLPTKGDWEAFHDFVFTGKVLKCLGDFVKKSSAIGVAKATVDVERERSKKKCGSHAGTSVVLDECSNPKSFFAVTAKLFQFCKR